MTNRKLIKIQNEEFVLSDLKGNPFICPFQNSHLIQGQLAGQIINHKPQCSSACALFVMETLPENKIRVTKNCASQHDVEVLTVEDNSSNSPILQS
jgi:hypothetical protein